MQGVGRVDAVICGMLLVLGVAIGLPSLALWGLVLIVIGYAWWAQKLPLSVTIVFSALLCGHHGVVVLFSVPITLAKVAFLSLFLQLVWARRLRTPSLWVSAGFVLLLVGMALSGRDSSWPWNGYLSTLSMVHLSIMVLTLSGSLLREEVSKVLQQFGGVLLCVLLVYLPEGLAAVMANTADSGWIFRSEGPTGHPNKWASVLLVYFPVVFNRMLTSQSSSHRWGAVGLATLVPLVVLQTTSRGSILVLGVLALLLAVFYRRHWKTIWLSLPLFVLLSLLFLDRHGVVTRMQTVVNRTAEIDLGYWSLDVRLRTAHYAWQAWLSHPWFGVGVDNSADVIQSLSEPSMYRRPHNSYLLVLMEQGVIGVLTFGAMLSAVFVEWRHRLTASSVSFRSWALAWLPTFGVMLCLALFGDLLTYPLFWLLIALSIADLRSAKAPISD